MNSRRRSQGNPIESVSLTVSFRSTKDEASRLSRLIPSLTFRKGECKVRIETGSSKEAAEKARYLLEKVREVIKPAGSGKS